MVRAVPGRELVAGQLRAHGLGTPEIDFTYEGIRRPLIPAALLTTPPGPS